MRNVIRILMLALFANLIMWNVCFADNKDNVPISEKIPVGKAVVYIYHSGGSNHRFFLQANGKDVTSLRKGLYYTYVTEPGLIEFTAKTMGTCSITVDAKAGQADYLKGSVPPGFSPTPSLVLVSSEVGAKEIVDCTLISSP
jgi:hypothetical protein